MRTDAALVQHRRAVSVAPLRLVADPRLVEEVRDGSERAFEALVERHRGPLLEFCRRLLGSREDAEDVVQQTFLVAWGDISRAQGPRALRPWLYGIARHRCLSLLRTRRARSVVDGPEAAVDDVAAEVATREELRALLTDLARLPDDQRTALVLAELGDASHEEVALLLGCRREKVKALTYQARSTLAASRRARETPCAEIREQLATLRGAGLRRASLRRHLRDCGGCRAFRDELRRERSRLRAVPSLFPIAALRRIVFGAGSGTGGAGTGVAALASSAVSGGGLLATAIATVAIPLAGISVALSARADDRAAAARPAAGRYGPSPAHAHPSASGGPRRSWSVTPRMRDGARAGNRPPRVAERSIGRAPAPGDGAEDPGRTSGPAPRESEAPSHAVGPPGADAPRSSSPTRVPASPAAPSPSTSPDSRHAPAPPTPPVPVAPSRPRGHSRPERPAPPAAPSPPRPAPRPTPDDRSGHPPPAASERPTDPAPRTDGGPSPPVAGTPGGAPSGRDGEERGTAGPPVEPGDHRP